MAWRSASTASDTRRPDLNWKERNCNQRCQLFTHLWFTTLFHTQSKWSGEVMNNIIYLVGAVVIVLFILSFVGIV